MKLISLAVSLGVLTFALSTMAGAIGGPKIARDTVSAKSTDSFYITFEGKQRAAVWVAGDGSTDLDCYVYDNGGNLIGSDTDATDKCLISWTPAWTGKFKLVIVNTGSQDNEYEMRTN